jgi:hypothetical protein
MGVDCYFIAKERDLSYAHYLDLDRYSTVIYGDWDYEKEGYVDNDRNLDTDLFTDKKCFDLSILEKWLNSITVHNFKSKAIFNFFEISGKTWEWYAIATDSDDFRYELNIQLREHCLSPYKKTNS